MELEEKVGVDSIVDSLVDNDNNLCHSDERSKQRVNSSGKVGRALLSLHRSLTRHHWHNSCPLFIWKSWRCSCSAVCRRVAATALPMCLRGKRRSIGWWTRTWPAVERKPLHLANSCWKWANRATEKKKLMLVSVAWCFETRVGRMSVSRWRYAVSLFKGQR